MLIHHQKVLWIKNFWAVFFSTKGALSSTKGALRRHPDPTYPFLALNQLNRPQKLASGHGQSPINYELRWNCHCNIFAAFDKYLLWNILIFVLYIRIWHGDLNLRYQSKGNPGGEVNVCQEFQLALAGAPDSSYKSSKKKHTALLARDARPAPWKNRLPCPAPKKASPAPPRPGAEQGKIDLNPFTPWNSEQEEKPSILFDILSVKPTLDLFIEIKNGTIEMVHTVGRFWS